MLCALNARISNAKCPCSDVMLTLLCPHCAESWRAARLSVVACDIKRVKERFQQSVDSMKPYVYRCLHVAMCLFWLQLL